MRGSLLAAMCSDSFLYLQQGDLKKTRQQLSDYELASRLSYFLWSTMPDERLRALGEGLVSPEGIAAAGDITALRRLTLTRCEELSDDGLKLASTLTQLEQLELGSLELPEARLPQLQAFSFLKELKFYFPKGYSPEIQAKIKTLLPTVDVKFTPCSVPKRPLSGEAPPSHCQSFHRFVRAGRRDRLSST